MASYYNITTGAGLNGATYVTINSCDESGAISQRADYSYGIYVNPTMRYTPATGNAAASFQIVSHNGQKSPTLTMDSVINLNGSAHGALTTEALASDVKGLITA